MEPIINPFIFYIIFLGGSLGNVLITLCIGIMITAMLYAFEAEISKAKKFFAIGILVLLFESIIPNEATCYRMLAASAVTPNNLTAVGQTAEDIVDYIIESVDKMLDEEDKE